VRNAIVFTVGFLMIGSVLTQGADRPHGEIAAGRSAVVARNGMVATSQPLAAQAGLDILKKGGNAFDAAVATAAVLAVVEPMMTGPGGDMFALSYVAKTGELVGLNASGFSPGAVDASFFSSRNLDAIPMTGPQSVSIPGAVDGWATLLEAHGTMSLAEVLAPAIEYAEQGFPVSEIIAGDWEKHGAGHADKAPFAATFLPGGKAPGHADVFRNPDLAKTFRQISEGGRDAFYKGEFAHKMVAHLNAQDWPVTLDDLAFQHSDWVEPISTTYRGYEVFELPPNGQGMAALEMLNILEGFDLRSLGFNSSAYLHRLVEAKKLAFADLGAWLADPQRSELPVPRLISKDYGVKQRARIDLEKAAVNVASGVDRDGDTVYLTVVDKDRNAVSFIYSIFFPFGSGEVVPGTGVVLQNRGALFTLEDGHPNQLEPRKRPYHTIIPAMAFKDGKPWLSFGVMGGAMQPQGHVQVLLNMIEFGMNVQDAGEVPRFCHLGGDGLALETGVDRQTQAELIQMGHELVSRPGVFGGYQAIEIDWERGVLIGGTDPRKDGCVAAW
jgi:gamma-glutamyltranspeptidase/glutathione hydrolase